MKKQILNKMKNLSSNTKQLAVAILVTVVAIGTQAYKPEKSVPAKGMFATANYGYNLTTGQYALIAGTPNTVLCESSGSKCIVVYTYSTTNPPASISKAAGDASPAYGDSPTSNSHYFE